MLISVLMDVRRSATHLALRGSGRIWMGVIKKAMSCERNMAARSSLTSVSWIDRRSAPNRVHGVPCRVRPIVSTTFTAAIEMLIKA